MKQNNPFTQLSLIPGFSELTHIQKDTVQKQIKLLNIDSGATIFADHAACNDFIFLLQGSVQVQRISANGHEITLYHLKKGDTCGLTASCLLGHTQQHANLIAETPIEAVLLPHKGFHYFMRHSTAFKAFILIAIDRDINALLNLMEDMNFSSIESRLAQKLIHCIGPQSGTSKVEVKITHNILAAELGTAREVVSRGLEKLAQKNHLRLFRGHIEILNLSALKKLAQE